ncbi:MAG: hypothetical protein SFT92_07220 [Rickettsiales bacterium]|nr:hypothetical protein [Rickettsiales bacterium]
MGLVDKIKTGTVGFVKSALNYIPSGIVFTAVAIGALVLAGKMGVPFLAAYANPTMAGLLTHAAISLTLGSLISGGIGAVQEVKHAEMLEPPRSASPLPVIERARSQSLAASHAIEPQPQIPLSANLAQGATPLIG